MNPVILLLLFMCSTLCMAQTMEVSKDIQVTKLSEKILFGGCMLKDCKTTGLGNITDATPVNFNPVGRGCAYIHVHLCHKLSSGPCLWCDSHHKQNCTCRKNSAAPISRLIVYPQ